MTRMKELRSDAVDFIKAAFPNWDVTTYMSEKTIAKPTVMVGGSTIERGTTHVIRRRQVTVMVVTPKTTPGQADDALDDLVEELLDVLDELDSAVWSSVQRVVYSETYPAYTINLTLED